LPFDENFTGELGMRKLDKSTLAQTFKFDCDRFLRLKLANQAEKERLEINDLDLDEKYRPGIKLVREEGVRWETEKYQDLIDLSLPNTIIFRLENKVDPRFGRQIFDKITETEFFSILRQGELPSLIFQPEFVAPRTITPALETAYRLYNLDPVSVRPDILWIRKRRSDTPLINGKNSVEYEIHVIDVKMTAEPNLRHFAEVTFYTLALAAALKEQKLDDRFAVSGEGLIFPGSHDANKFRNLYKDLEAKGSTDLLSDAFDQTLIAVPHEVYQSHVRQFFEDRLLRVLAQEIEETEWHVCPKSQTCDYMGFCQQNAKNEDHLSRLAWLTHGQARTLRENGIKTTKELAEHIRQNSTNWQSALNTNHQLRAEQAVWLARAEALQTNSVQIAEGRKSALMPAGSNMNIYLTVHSDPGSGITFAMGAKKVYFPPDCKQGDPPQTETQTFIVDTVDAMNTDSERERLVEIIECVSTWLEEVSAFNQTAARDKKLRAHIFFWDGLEIKQLKRMIERHLEHPSVVEKVELLLRLFPPDSSLPDPEMFKSQPGTIVKDVFRTLFGLPIPFDYTLLEVANSFYPTIKKDGTIFKYDLPYGFKAELSKDVYALTDQIPFERAYELWQNNVMLKHFNPLYPDDSRRWRKYTRVEIYNGLQNAVKVRLDALSEIVLRLRRNHKDKLVLRKSPFSAAPVRQIQLPQESRQLVAFTKLNLVAEEIKNRQARALPVEEREARFISIRGLRIAVGEEFDRALMEVRREKPEKANREMWAMTFSANSRDAKIREGDFMLALTNENSDLDLDMPLFHQIRMDRTQLENLLESENLDRQKAYWRLSNFLKVEVVKLDSISDPPFLILTPSNVAHFNFARKIGLIDFSQPMIADPIFDDFNEGKRTETVMRLIGGTPPKRTRKTNAKKATTN
jgi:hypothetical protein